MVVGLLEIDAFAVQWVVQPFLARACIPSTFVEPLEIHVVLDELCLQTVDVLHVIVFVHPGFLLLLLAKVHTQDLLRAVQMLLAPLHGAFAGPVARVEVLHQRQLLYLTCQFLDLVVFGSDCFLILFLHLVDLQ